MEHLMKFKFLAGLLAAGGIFWTFFSIAASRISDSFLVSLVFVPGYIVTVGHVIRCVCTPRLSWRRVIWGASVFVQGAWLVAIISALICGELRYGGVAAADVFGPMVLWFWWAFALGISIHAYRFDKRQAA
jgi:hypothetical protein